jgi:hypothetical protein
MGAPPVVQGHPSPHYQQTSHPSDGIYSSGDQEFASSLGEPLNGSPNDFNGEKGEMQPKKFNDVPFAVAFVAHLGVMAYFLVAYSGIEGGQERQQYNYTGIVYFVCICGAFALALASVALGFMMKFSQELVKAALFFSVSLSLAVGIIGALSGQVLMAVMGFISFAVGCCYAYFVRSRIPFAAANLNTALSAVKANMGLSVVAYFFLAVALCWSIWWSVAAGGALNGVGSGIIFLFLVSYYWTHQVIQNTVHVTVAGVVGTWWFVPDEASSFWSPAIKDSFSRATTHSFGSICFGSLLVALIQALRHLQHILRENEDFNILVCLIECLLACVQSIIEYLNSWAYTYVGLYGYSYLDAGRNVITLFQHKGWSSIISDDLAENVLFMMSIGIGLLTGLVGLIISTLDKNIFADIGLDEGDVGSASFFVGFLVGFILTSILMSVVGSAVKTCIVCFAESPAEFEANHPQLSQEMRAAWREAWPTECANL